MRIQPQAPTAPVARGACAWRGASFHPTSSHPTLPRSMAVLAAVVISGSPPMCPSVASSARPILLGSAPCAGCGCWMCVRQTRARTNSEPVRPSHLAASCPSSISPMPLSGVSVTKETCWAEPPRSETSFVVERHHARGSESLSPLSVTVGDNNRSNRCRWNFQIPPQVHHRRSIRWDSW